MAEPEDAGRLFDRFHADYGESMARGLSLSGEDRHFFARHRIAFLAGCLRELGLSPRSVMDYGCGTGSATPLFRELLRVDTVLGVDASEKSLATARRGPRLAGHRLPARLRLPAGRRLPPRLLQRRLPSRPAGAAPGGRSPRAREPRAGGALLSLGQQSLEPRGTARDAAHPVRPRRLHALGPGGPAPAGAGESRGRPRGPPLRIPARPAPSPAPRAEARTIPARGSVPGPGPPAGPPSSTCGGRPG